MCKSVSICINGIFSVIEACPSEEESNGAASVPFTTSGHAGVAARRGGRVHQSVGPDDDSSPGS